jgi:hypothetical protein
MRLIIFVVLLTVCNEQRGVAVIKQIAQCEMRLKCEIKFIVPRGQPWIHVV